MAKELIYGLVDQEGILINPVVVQEGDVETLETLKTHWKASSYHLLDPELYLINVGKIYYNGTHWDLVSNK